jgi:hypothetical protein
MSYALIELDTGNIVGFFATERAALEDVLDSIDRYGLDSVDTLGLAFNDPDPAGPVRRIAVGPELARRALEAFAPAQASPSGVNGSADRTVSDSESGLPVGRQLRKR